MSLWRLRISGNFLIFKKCDNYADTGGDLLKAGFFFYFTHKRFHKGFPSLNTPAGNIQYIFLDGWCLYE